MELDILLVTKSEEFLYLMEVQGGKQPFLLKLKRVFEIEDDFLNVLSFFWSFSLLYDLSKVNYYILLILF